MGYDIVIYCPDRHIQYDARTPCEVGIGGGVTTRIRMAHALAKLGHQVRLIVNCPIAEEVAGVNYLPLDQVTRIDTDILIVHTSGGDYDISPLKQLSTRARMRILWTAGIDRPHGLDLIQFDSFYAVSNFIRDQLVTLWRIPTRKIFVSYNGFDEALFSACEEQDVRHDPYRLIYASHPAKGLDAGLAVLDLLRTEDERYHMVVCGGEALWGQNGGQLDHPGVISRGLIGQHELTKELYQAGYSLCLQNRLEPFGMILTESMRAGAIVVASQVGAFPELIQDRTDGFVLPGDPMQARVQQQAADLIRMCNADNDLNAFMRHNARQCSWNSYSIAQVWSRHWDWWLGADPVSNEPVSQRICSFCGGQTLVLDDGYHCLDCARYARLFAISASQETKNS